MGTLRWSRPLKSGREETATASSSSRRRSGEVDYDDSRSRSLHSRRCHIRRVAYVDAGRGGNGAARRSNENEATAAMDIMVRRIDDGALLHESAVTVVRRLHVSRELNASVRNSSVKKV